MNFFHVIQTNRNKSQHINVTLLLFMYEYVRHALHGSNLNL